ncbi:hypothetical protein Z517_08370 [Fonsecaea pedrosoi CBS 271.37]|uniref:Uncharacterized protein n=1 Tax=Fonsecaea pedrosoi CBS 271.37 TaxID=1442368 RepID=A0A0D2EWH4_9EURO|nr:uncharacterized protein Z517_08370 [Fonsecaea pedrosoi CBS 271.37]KIW78532.1 hypothetical protein Z517_08370 [Fonsecaea pedrosoi CBS 271.37]
MSIASVLNDSQDEDQKTDDQTSQPNEVQSIDDGTDSRDFTDYCPSEATSASSFESSIAGRKRRRPRRGCKKYTNEQRYFIWYHRTDLKEAWDDVEREFLRQFGEVRKKSGLQCKFYRVLHEAKVEKVREQAKSGRRYRGDLVGRFGVVDRTAERFAWMRPEDQSRPPLPCFATDDCRNPTYKICAQQNKI